MWFFTYSFCPLPTHNSASRLCSQTFSFSCKGLREHEEADHMVLKFIRSKPLHLAKLEVLFNTEKGVGVRETRRQAQSQPPLWKGQFTALPYPLPAQPATLFKNHFHIETLKQQRNLLVFYRKHSKKAISKTLSSWKSRKATQDPLLCWRKPYLDPAHFVCTGEKSFAAGITAQQKLWFFHLTDQYICKLVLTPDSKNSSTEYVEQSQATISMHCSMTPSKYSGIPAQEAWHWMSTFPSRDPQLSAKLLWKQKSGEFSMEDNAVF